MNFLSIRKHPSALAYAKTLVIIGYTINVLDPAMESFQNSNPRIQSSRTCNKIMGLKLLGFR